MVVFIVVLQEVFAQIPVGAGVHSHFAHSSLVLVEVHFIVADKKAINRLGCHGSLLGFIGD
jgi:hypothetical protein